MYIKNNKNFNYSNYKKAVIITTMAVFAFMQINFSECIAQEGQGDEDTSLTKILVEITNLGKGINTVYSEYAPVISADEKQMLFTRLDPKPKGVKCKKITNKVFENVYMIKRTKRWGLPRKLTKPINTITDDCPSNNSAIAFSPDGQRMLLFKAEKGEGGLLGDIYESKLKGRRWLDPVKLDSAINSPAHESSASYSYDGKTIFFTSEKEGGLGGLDIYKSTMGKDGNWGEAVNLGPTINTPEDDECIFTHPDGITIYFSSKGHNSIGGYDIFKSVLQNDGSWSEPENINELNTTEDDRFFVMSANGEHGYYSSVREGGFGGHDIYMVTFTVVKKEKKEKPKSYVTLLMGVIKDEVTGQPVEADIEITDNIKNESVAVFNSNSETGEYLVCLPYGRNYGITVSAVGYLFHSENINLVTITLGEKAKLNLINEEEEILKTVVINDKGFFVFESLPFDKSYIFMLDPDQAYLVDEIQIILRDENGEEKIIRASQDSLAIYKYEYIPMTSISTSELIEKEKKAVAKQNASLGYQEITKNIALKKVVTGAKIVLNNIFFDFDKAILRLESTAELERLSKLLNENASLRIEISGHTDSKGSDEYNQNLSERRAKAVVDYLIGNAIDKERLEYKGYGESQPIASNDTDQGMQENRRTEFKVLEE
ncbi:MAG: OmpA family protein [Bacteroidota bacterium]